MDLIDCENLTEDQFVERYLNVMGVSMDEIDSNEMEVIETSVNNNVPNTGENGGPEISKNGTLKRRSNLTEFGSCQTAKRKNESAKRELTSIVRQVFAVLRTFFFITTPQKFLTRTLCIFVAEQNR